MPGPKRDKSPNIVAWLQGKTVEDLAAIRRGAHNYYPDAITFYEPDGTPREERILIRVPKPKDIVGGRVDAISYVSKQVPKGSSFKVETVEDARKFLGSDEFEVIDNCAIAARCMHDPEVPAEDTKKPPPPWKNLDLLLEDHEKDAILDVFARINFLANTFSPRFDELTEPQMWWAAKFIAERENASPLVAMHAGTQYVFLCWVCKLAMQAMPSLPST